MSLYNASLLFSSMNPVDWFTTLNDMSGGVFVNAIFVAVFAALFIAIFSASQDMTRSMAFSGFFGVVIGALLWWMGLIVMYTIMLPLCFLIAAILLRGSSDG